jgi:nucleoid DNA-binding protein
MNNQSELNTNFQNKSIAADTIDNVIVNALLEGRNVIIPDFGYLELKLFPDNRRTVLFKATHPQDLPSQIYLDGTESEDHFSILWNCISKPLKDGKAVLLPNLGIFRPLRRGDGNFHVSFTPSSILRKRLNLEEGIIRKEQNPEPDVENHPGFLRANEPELPLPVIGEPELPQAIIENENKQEEETFFVDERFKRKRKNIGYLLTSVVLIVLIVIITIGFSQNGEEDIPPVSSFQPRPRNLVDVAKENYGNPVFWVYIYESNQEKLTSPVNIPENLTLTIPDLSEYNIDITDSLEIIRARIRSESILQKYMK